MPARTPTEVSENLLRAALASSADGYAENYAEDAIMYGLGPKFESRGREEIRKEFQAIFAVFQVEDFKWDDHINVVGDVAYAWGSFKMVARNRHTRERAEFLCRTLDVRRKQADGSWKVVVDHASLPLPPALPQN